MELNCVVDAGAELGEGPFWDDRAQCLWWVDIYGQSIHRYDPKTGENLSYAAPEPPGCLAPRADSGLIVAMKSGFYFFDPLSRIFTHIADPEAELTDTRFNDGRTDRQGRFWAGTIFEAEGKSTEFIAGLWRMDGDQKVTRILDGIGCANGLAFSPDSRLMYFTDSETHLVWQFDFDAETGTPTNRRVFLDFTADGYVCDGATVDSDGNFWMAAPFHSQVLAFSPSGESLTRIDMPTDMPTCVEFGGPDLATLFVTTARYHRSDAELAGQTAPGGLFAVTGTGAKGIAPTPFRG